MQFHTLTSLLAALTFTALVAAAPIPAASAIDTPIKRMNCKSVIADIGGFVEDTLPFIEAGVNVATSADTNIGKAVPVVEKATTWAEKICSIHI